jgi:hypothetical protein
MAEEIKEAPKVATPKKPGYKIVGLKEAVEGEGVIVNYGGRNYDLTRLTDEETAYLLTLGTAFPYIVKA